jgi:hypothetical protein
MKPDRKRPIPPESIARFFGPPPAATAEPPMTLAEYLDSARFPLTTQPGLRPGEQFLTDAESLGQLRGHLGAGGVLTDWQRARLAELEEKEKARSGLIDEAEVADNERSRRGSSPRRLPAEQPATPPSGGHPIVPVRWPTSS